MSANLKIKIRFKLEEESGKVMPIRRITVGKLKPFPDQYYIPECVSQNFLFIEGRNFFVDRPRQIAETIQEETKDMFVPLSEIRSITVLPDDLDINEMEYRVSGSRLICQSTKQQVTLKEEGAAR